MLRRRWVRRVMVLALLLAVAVGVTAVVLWNRPYAFMGAARGAARWWLGLTEHEIEIDGHRWPYLTGGPPDAPPVVLLHGYGTSKDAMMSIMSWLAADHRVIAPDLPGFGAHDDHGAVAHDGAFYAREVLRFMDALGVERASLVGTSMGGAIAAEIAITAPERVARLVLLAPAGIRAPKTNDFMRRADAGENPLELETEEDFDRIIQLVFLHPPPTPAPVRRYFTLEAQRRLEGTNRIIPALRDYGERGLDGRLERIEAPTLILWGIEDQVLDPSALPTFANGIRRSRAVMVPRAGHVLFHDAPEFVRSEIVPFLAPNAPEPAHPGILRPFSMPERNAATGAPPPS